MKMAYIIITAIGLGMFLFGAFLIAHQMVYKKNTTATPLIVKDSKFFIDAGCNQTIYLPGNVVKLKGDAYCDSGLVAAWMWTQKSGPRGEIQDPVSKETLVKGLSVAGTYVFNFRAINQYGKESSSTVTITVEAFPE